MQSVAVVVPVYNESDLIGRYVRELDEFINGRVAQLSWFLLDDASTDDTAAVLQDLGRILGRRASILRNPANLGHGPTVLRGYAAALESNPDLVIQVDGDGHYSPAAVAAMIDALRADADVACGIRQARQDPWFRLAISNLLRYYIGILFGTWVPDPNIGLRGYRRDVLRRCIGWAQQFSRLPNLSLSIATERLGYRHRYVPVEHHRRPGAVDSTTFKTTRRSWAPPLRLLRFSAACLAETFVSRLRLGALNRSRTR